VSIGPATSCPVAGPSHVVRSPAAVRTVPVVTTDGDQNDAGGLDESHDVYWYVGGPLDGRTEKRPAEEEVPATIRHVHLHDGPKIVHHYDLHEVAGHGGEYRLRDDD
jgi:hypothetical protein